MQTLFNLMRQAGIDPKSDDWKASPFKTVAADPTGEIVRDTRNGDLWFVDDESNVKTLDWPYDAPVHKVTQADVDAMLKWRKDVGAVDFPFLEM